MNSWLSWSSLSRPGSHKDLSASASQVLGLKVCAVLRLCICIVAGEYVPLMSTGTYRG